MAKLPALNGSKSALIAVAVLLFALAATLILRQFRTSNYAAANAFYSSDDGATFFESASTNFPPFSHSGKDAVGARVFVDAAGRPFVGYLERYTPEGKVRAAELLAQRSAGTGTPGRDDILYANMEVKRPGEKEWVKLSDPKARGIRTVMCPDKPNQPATLYQPTIH